MDLVASKSIKMAKTYPVTWTVNLDSCVVILMDVLGPRSLGSISLWLPGPEDLRDFSVEEELGGLTYLGKAKGHSRPSSAQPVHSVCRLLGVAEVKGRSLLNDRYCRIWSRLQVKSTGTLSSLQVASAAARSWYFCLEKPFLSFPASPSH